jgi:DNA polymerase I
MSQIIIQTKEQLNNALTDLLKSDEIIFDIETNQLKRFMNNSKILTISFSSNKNIYGVCFQHTKNDIKIEYTLDEAIQFLQKIADSNIVKGGHNVKFDVSFIDAVYKIKVKNVKLDSILMAHLIDENDEMNLGYLSEKYLNVESHKEMVDRKNLENELLSLLLKYNMLDVLRTKQLINKLLPKILENDNYNKIYFKEKAKLIYSLSDMENEGLDADLETISKVKAEYTKSLHRLSENYKLKLLKAIGDKSILSIKLSENEPIKKAFLKLGFNLTNLSDSGEKRKEYCKENNIEFIAGIKDLSFDYNTLDELKKFNTKKLKKDERIKYQKLVDDFVLPLMDFREQFKIYGTYIKGLSNHIEDDNKIHCNFNLVGTVGPRLACNDPNLQNIPRGPIIKQFFNIQDDDYVFVELDYSQGELRVLAIKSGDTVLKNAFLSGGDVHSSTAAMMFDVENVEEWLRTVAKSINFGLVYGMSKYALYDSLMATDLIYDKVKKDELKLDYDVCQDYIDKYFKLYSGVKKYMDNIKIFAFENGYTETCFGQRRHLEKLYQYKFKSQVDRQALNSPIQGTLGEIMNYNISRINEYIKKNNMKTKLCLTVHDSLLAKVHKKELKEYILTSKDLCENIPIEMMDCKGVPIVVDYKMGDNWAYLHKLKINGNKIDFK